MAKSLKAYFVFNMIRVISGIIFPLITFPYASLMLLADRIGHVKFFSSIINYVVLLTGLGILMYGLRKITRVRGDVKEFSKTTTELLADEILRDKLLKVSFENVKRFEVCAIQKRWQTLYDSLN